MTRAEALLAVADAVAAATRELLDGYAPPAVNLDEDVSLKRVAHHIIANRCGQARSGLEGRSRACADDAGGRGG